MLSYKEKLNNVKTFIFDVDGVLTTGEVLLFNGDILRTLQTKDGYAIQFAAKLGYKIFIITGGNQLDVQKQLLALGVTEVFLSSSNKMETYAEICSRYNISDEEVLFMGDDIPDYPLLKVAGVSTCPQDAAVDIKAVCDYQSPFLGGKGCVRDVIEQVLRLNGQWMNEVSFHW